MTPTHQPPVRRLASALPALGLLLALALAAGPLPLPPRAPSSSAGSTG